MTDPFAAPAVIPSTFASAASFRGRLVLISPKKIETVPNSQGAPGATQDRVTADVTVVDGAGPVPLYTRGAPNGQTLDGPDFPGTFFSQERIVAGLRTALTTGGMVLARIDTRTPSTAPGKGNPWGLIDPTEEDKQLARNFLANRTVGAAMAPAAAPANPVHSQGQAAYAATPPAAPASNPFASAAPSPQAPGVNPFAPKA